MNIKIVKLLDKSSQNFKTICDWQYGFWGQKFEKEKVVEFMEHCLGEEKIPQTYICLIDDEIVGMYQIDMYDGVDVRPNYYPWLVNVYVDETQRDKGICKFIMNDAVNKFRDLGLKRIYLHTEHENLYEKFGWKFLEKVETLKNEIKKIYFLDVVK